MIDVSPHEVGGKLLGADRWNFIVPTVAGLATKKRDLLRGGVTVVVNSAISWTKGNRADVWATDVVAAKVGTFPPGLAVWGPPESEAAFLAAGIPFVVMPPNAVMGPGNVPREADAFFKALAFACEALKARRVRVFGAGGWTDKPRRWRRWALARLVREAGRHNIEIERVG